MRHFSNKNDDDKLFYFRHSTVYWSLFICWTIIMIAFEYYVIHLAIDPTFDKGHWILGSLLIFNQLFVGIFYYYGLYNLLFPIVYAFIRKREKKAELNLLDHPLPKNWHPRVKLLYTTFNDFIPYALNECMKQTYDNVQAVILDNSNDQHYIDMIRQFCLVHPDVQWVRKVPNHGAKAGNLNNYLSNYRNDYDYFVILDSDELLEPHFVEKCLKFFYYSSNLGILQANHISGSNTNNFQQMFSLSGNAFWPIQNSVRSTGSGRRSPDPKKRWHTADCVPIELGHGTMISNEAMASIDYHMPEMVAEDLCLSFTLLLKGYDIKFATQIYGNEQFPIDMEALMIRSSKFCRANFQFMKVFGKRLFFTRMLTFFQKLDLLTFTLSVPIFAIEYTSLLLCSIVFPLTGIPDGYVPLFIIPSFVAYFSQSIADSCFQFADGRNMLWVFKYEIQSILLYGSFYWTTVKSTFFAFIGRKAKFTVTPKSNNKVTYRQAFLNNWQAVVFSLVTIIVAWLCSGSSWILLSFAPGTIGWILGRKSNHQNKQAIDVKLRLQQGSIDALLHPNRLPVPWNIK